MNRTATPAEMVTPSKIHPPYLPISGVPASPGLRM